VRLATPLQYMRCFGRPDSNKKGSATVPVGVSPAAPVRRGPDRMVRWLGVRMFSAGATPALPKTSRGWSVVLYPSASGMANKFYSPGDQRAAKVNDLFAAIAPRYDLINDVQSFGLHRRWKRRVAELAAVQPGDRALDLCCGTGDIARALARRGAQVVGLDFSEQMLAVAKKRTLRLESCHAGAPSQRASVQGKNPQSAIHNPQFVRGDAGRIPFPDAEFDIVTVGYGLRNLANWETGLREMVRVAKPGARLLVLDFGKPDNPLWRSAYFGYLKLFVPLLGLVFCRNPGAYAYILESLKHYPAQRGVAARMRDLGLVNVGIVNFLGGAMSINHGKRAEGGAARLPKLTPL